MGPTGPFHAEFNGGGANPHQNRAGPLRRHTPVQSGPSSPQAGAVSLRPLHPVKTALFGLKTRPF
jgi:hypothetical protein